MKFGIGLPHFGRFASPDAIRRMTLAAETLGWHSVWLSDHVVVPNANREQFSDTFYELFTTLGYVAALTERVRIGTSVVVLPYRHPVMTAKQVATADRLAGGRLILGVAFGWNREEYGILGIPFEKRGRRADEIVQAMKACWGREDPEFHGVFYDFSGFVFSPQPVQRPHPPIWIGGNDVRALRRTVALGDGWHPISGPRIKLDMALLTAHVESLHRLATEAGRDPSGLTVSLSTSLRFATGDAMEGNLALVGSTQRIVDRVGRLGERGVSHLLLNCAYGMEDLHAATDVGAFVDTMERFTADVMSKFP